MTEPITPFRTDMLDFPTAWAIQDHGITHVDPRCSAVQTDGAMLCDCGAVVTAWEAECGRRENTDETQFGASGEPEGPGDHRISF